MGIGTTSHLATACRRLLRPIVRMLIRGGLPYREFADIAKTVYVDVASRDYGKYGRPTNAARVAILTGLSRKEVSRLRRERADEGEGGQADEGYFTTASRVLAGWHQDPAFTAADGQPLPLNVDAEAPSVLALLKRYGGDMPPVALLGELEHVGAVGRDADGRWRALKRYYMPAQLDATAISRSGSVLEDLGSTVAHNLFRQPGERARFEGRATNGHVATSATKAFGQLVESEGQALLQRIDDWLTEHEIGEEGSEHGSRPGKRLGLGIYWIEDD
jgi:hypothetical protein